MDIFIHYAIAASQFAAADSGLVIGPGERHARRRVHRVGHRRASGPSSASTRRCSKAGRARSRRSSSPRPSSTSPPGQVSIRLGAKGPNLATCTACAASAHAVGEAFEIIRRGAADAMIAGGSEAAITPMGVGGFAAMRALSTRNDEPERASRPFDKDRDGFVIGEGAGVLVLEELEGARRRGARDLRRGRRLRHDGRRVPHHGAVGGRRRRGARDGHGAAHRPASAPTRWSTSTPTARRRRSTTSSRRWPSSTLFGEHADALGVSSTKSMTGHLLGAAGGLEAGITALAVHHQMMPPTINQDTPDPECDSGLRALEGPDRRRSRTRCRTRSGSAAPTPPCCCAVSTADARSVPT